MRCPNCNGRCIGRVGSEQYYCWDCCVEFNVSRGAVRIYHLDADGELVAAATNQPMDLMTGTVSAMQRR
ncbi:MAG: hypothetical protein ACM3XM_19610 [Mycobacterium leprae]